MSDETKPPVLAGEVWRGEVGDVLTCVVVRGSGPYAFERSQGEWCPCGSTFGYAFRAALIDALARAEHAEKVAAAERRLRERAVAVGGHDEGCGCDGCAEYGAAEEALADALGVQP